LAFFIIVSVGDFIVAEGLDELEQNDLIIAQGLEPQPDARNPKGCGQTAFSINVMQKNNKIVGGIEAVKHSVPWIVSLRTSGRHFCAGTLIRVRRDKEESDIVVTAAHCLGGRSINVVAGAHYKQQAEPKEKSVAVAKDISHRRYDTPAHSNDIAVLKLSQSIKFNDHIQPACLPEKNQISVDGTMGLVAGWGTTGSGGTEKLMNVAVPVMGTQECKRYYGATLVPETMLCAGYKQGGKDSCQGDSGGPYTTKGKNGYTLDGVVSFGYGCAKPNAPGIYSRTSNYIDWIQEQIAKHSDVYRSA